MDDLLELLIEFLLDFAVEVGVDAVDSKKPLRKGRLACAIVALVLCFAIIIAVIVFGVMTLNKSLMGGLVIILTGIGLFFWFMKWFVIALIIKLVKKSGEMK